MGEVTATGGCVAPSGSTFTVGVARVETRISGWWSMGEFYGNQHTDGEFDDYDYEELVEAVEALADELGRPPTTEEAAADDRFPSIATIYRIVDSSWNDVLREAGSTPSKLQIRSATCDRMDTILDDIRRTNRETTGEYLTMRQYDSDGVFASSSVKERFGSWKEACTEAGVPVGTRHGVACEGPNGERLDSHHERSVTLFLDDCGVVLRGTPTGRRDGVSCGLLPPQRRSVGGGRRGHRRDTPEPRDVRGQVGVLPHQRPRLRRRREEGGAGS